MNWYTNAIKALTPTAEIRVLNLTTEPGGPWIKFLTDLVALYVPFRPGETPSNARKEAAMQMAVKELDSQLTEAGVLARVMNQRFIPNSRTPGERVFPRLCSHVYVNKGKGYFFASPDSPKIGQAGCLGDDSLKMNSILNAYNADRQLRIEVATRAVRIGFPAYKRPKNWGVQLMGPRVALVFAGGKHHLVTWKPGRKTRVTPRGNSMRPKVMSGATVTLEPVEIEQLKKGDIVLCKVKGKVYLHLVKAMQRGRVLIGNNHGGTNGWTRTVWGRAIHVEQP